MRLTPPPDFNPDQPSTSDLLWAYRHGVFPMGDPRTGELDWFAPDPRGIIPLDAFHVPRNLGREVRRRRFSIRSDTAFEQVIRECSTARSRINLTWISEPIMQAYIDLHRQGHAHCIEAWLGTQLVGGLYGVHIDAAFFGESMFSRPSLGGTSASKVCLVHLVRWLNLRGFELLDVQFRNEHLAQFGCIEIPRREYLARLRQAVDKPVEWGQFTTLEPQMDADGRG